MDNLRLKAEALRQSAGSGMVLLLLTTVITRLMKNVKFLMSLRHFLEWLGLP